MNLQRRALALVAAPMLAAVALAACGSGKVTDEPAVRASVPEPTATRLPKVRPT